MQSIGAWQDSQTTDEAVHLSAGRSYWQTNDFRLNPEHPPLIKLLASVPLLFMPGTQIDTASQIWRDRQEWEVGITMLYGPDRAGRQAQLIMFLGRLPMILVWAALGGVIFAWARSRWGNLAGLMSLLAYAFDPNFLGHGHLVTTDVGVALGFVGTIWLTDRFLRQPTWSRLGWLSLVFALTQVTKFSAIILWVIVPLLGLMYLAYRPAHFSGQWWWRLVASLVVMTSVVTWVVYGFQVQPIDSDPRIAQLWQERQQIVEHGLVDQQPPIVKKVIGWTDPQSPTGRWIESASHWSVPAYSYWRGLTSTLSHNVWGHPAYLLGQTYDFGWWYYFPVALAVKTPAITLLLVLGSGLYGGLQWFSRFRGRSWSSRIPFDAWLLGFPPLLFLAWSMSSHINIGLRHIFPIEPFMFLSIGSLVTVGGRLWQRGLLLAVCTLPIVAITSWPNTIGYFSGMFGGTREGYRYLLDSNLDWNQDIWRLNSFLHQHRFDEVHMVLFGSVPYRTLFPGSLSVLTDQEIDQGLKPSGIVIISAGQLYNQDGPFSWLRPYHPNWRVGSSITVYDFR